MGIGNLLTSKIKIKISPFMHHVHLGLTYCIHMSLIPLNNCRINQKNTQGRSQGLVNHLLLIRSSRFKVVRALFNFKVQNIKNNWYYIINMWHSIQIPSTKWDFVAECHRSLLNRVMDKKLIKRGGGG